MSSRLSANHLLLSALAKRKASKNPLQAGFTLVELLIVVIIIGILASVALPGFLNQANKAKVSAAKAISSSAAKECQVWLVEGTGTFALTTKGGNGLTLTGPTCTVAAGGTFTTEHTNPALSYVAAVGSDGGVTKKCSGEGCTGTTW